MPDRQPARLWTIFARVDLGLLESVSVSVSVPSPQSVMCFRIQSFQHRAIRFCGRLGALENPDRERAGFLIMPKRPNDWRVDSHGCHKCDNVVLGFGPRHQTAHLPVFLHLCTTNLPGPDSIMRSERAQQRRIERRHNKPERAKRRRT